MWWAIETLTTVGYGDIVPVTAAGRILGGVVTITGIGTLALFSGLITVGFLDQLKLHRQQHPKVAVSRKTIPVAAVSATCPHCGATLSPLSQDKVGETLGA
jgi:voltage-gated potassium channel